VFGKTVTMIQDESTETARIRAAHCGMEATAGGELDRRGGLPRRATAMIAAMAFAACLGGCQAQTIPPPSADLRAQFSEIGVYVSSASLTAPAEPATGAGSAAAYGAGQGAMGSLGFGAAFCRVGEPILCVLGAALSVATLPFTSAAARGAAVLA